MPRRISARLLGARTSFCIAFAALTLFLVISQTARSQFSRQFIADYDLRNPDYPNTHIAEIKLDLTNPDH